jgi:dynein heavy chain
LMLKNSGDTILEDDSLVNSLNDSKKITDDINHKLSSAKILSDRIEDLRRSYRPVAVHGARLFFLV